MYDYMLENTDPDLVFFEMDVYWTVRGQKAPVDYFKKYPKRFRLLHIKDEKELGDSGMVGFDAIFKHAADAGMEYPVVEVERYSFAPSLKEPLFISPTQADRYTQRSNLALQNLPWQWGQRLIAWAFGSQTKL